MGNKLKIVADWEKRKEEQFAQSFQQASEHLAQNKQKLSGLEQYRLEYLRQAQQKAQGGLEALNFSQHQSFIGKLDKACDIQRQQISQAKLVVDQRRTQWLNQQKKRKAVDMLIDKHKKQAHMKAEKAEQSALDEFALQKFVRSRQS